MSKTSIIIPTLNRPIDLQKTLNSLLQLTKKPYEVIIIDQSDNDETKKLVKSDIYIKLNISYFHFSVKSLTQARNYGVEQLKADTDYVQFFDDDVILEPDFLEQLEIFFTSHPKAKGGVANISAPSRKITFLKHIGLFLLSGRFTTDKTFITAGGFNVMPLKTSKHLQNVQRTSGCGMFFRKEVFDEGFRFEQQFMKYSLMEDAFLSYAIQEKYPNSLFFVPSLKMTHCESPASRIANKQRIYQNIIHRYYFIKKFHKSFLAYLRTMLVFICFDFLQYRSFKIFSRYFQGLRYIFQHKKKIGNADFNFNEFIFGVN